VDPAAASTSTTAHREMKGTMANMLREGFTFFDKRVTRDAAAVAVAMHLKKKVEWNPVLVFCDAPSSEQDKDCQGVFPLSPGRPKRPSSYFLLLATNPL